MKAEFKLYLTDRICNEEINKEEIHVIFGEFSCSGNYVNIHFHNKCLAESYGKFLESLK